MTEKKIKHWAIIGCGKHATQVMIPAFSDCRRSKLQAIASENPDTRARLASRHPDIRVYKSYSEVLADDSIDAIYIGLPNNLHAQWSIAALQAGKHVLCDKPLTLCEAEARNVQRVAQEVAKFCAPAFMYRFHPQYDFIRKNIDEGMLGKIHSIEGHFHYSLSDFNNIRWKKENGGGALYDVGCYVIDVAQFLLREPLAVASATLQMHPSQKVDEFAAAHVLSDSGTSIFLTASMQLARTSSLCIRGSKASLEIPRAFRVPRNSRAEIRFIPSGEEKERRITFEPANQFAIEIDTFSAKISSEAIDEELFSDGINGMKIIDELRAKARYV